MRRSIRWIAMLAGVLAALPALAQEPAIDWGKVNAEAIAKLREYIRVDTQNPPGNEMRGVEWLKKIFDAEGIACETGESTPGRGSIVARLKGTGNEPAIILLSHIDVVPVNREFWTVDPFAGELRDGYIWGRGAIDMKNQGIAELMALLLLHRNKVPLRRDVIFIATADEEAGGKFGAGWVAKNRPQWYAGAGFLLNEGSPSRADESGKTLFIGVSGTEKTPAWLKLTATGRAGHGSVPIPDSAVNKLVAALERLRRYEPPLELTPPIARALRSRASYEPEPWRNRLRNLREFLKQPDARRELARRPELLALVTNTVSITGLQGTNKINIIPPVATALVDCRLLPTWTANRWAAEVRRVIADDSIQIEVLENFPPSTSPLDTPLYRSVVEAVKRVHPGAGVTEALINGFTDSHLFREKGIVSYGFEAVAMTEKDDSRAHGNDERVPVKAFTDSVRLMWEVVYGFSKAQ